jgi:hypothetical protein
MATPPTDPEPRGSALQDSEAEAGRDTPRWVKIFAIVAVIVIVLIVVLLLLGGGHSPGRHTAGAAGQDAVSGALPQTTRP